MELFKLFGRVLVETSDAEKNLKNTDKISKDATKNIGSYAEKIKAWAVALKSLIVTSSFVKALKEILSISESVAIQADSIDKASQKIGVSAQFYQKWDYILKRNGTSMEEFGEAIYDLSKRVGAADEATLAAFERIGVGVNEVMTATPEELFEHAITGLFKIDSLTERAAISTTLFTERSKLLGPTLNGTEKDVDSLATEYEGLNGAMSDSLVKMGAAYADAKLNYETAWQGVKNHFAENTLPGMTLSLQGFTEFLTGDFESAMEDIGNGIKSFFDGILSYMAEWRENLESYLNVDFSIILDNPRYNPFAILDPSTMTGTEVPEDFDTATEAKKFASDLWNGWEDIRSDILSPSGTDRSGKFAVGLPFVPRDNYPAQLHYGERVLTRQEAEEYNSGKGTGGGFNQTVNISTVSQTPAQTAAAIRAAFETARWTI